MYLYSQACISRAPSIARLRWQQLRAGVHLALADNKLGTGGGRAGFIAQTATACSVWPDLHAKILVGTKAHTLCSSGAGTCQGLQH